MGRLRPVQAREHELEQGRLAAREAHVRLREDCQPLGEAASVARHRRLQFLTEALEAGFGEGVQQRLLVRKVLPRRAMADPDVAGGGLGEGGDGRGDSDSGRRDGGD
jgi:hypothetical protein